MTAHQLAQILLEGPDLMVTRRGYEYGVEEIRGVDEPSRIHLDAHKGKNWCGNHEYCENEESCPYCDIAPTRTLAIHIG